MVDYRDASNGRLGFTRKRENHTEPPGNMNKNATPSRSKLSLLSWSAPTVSETSSSSDEEDRNAPNEFVIECENEEMVFVTAAQGKVIKARCRYFDAELSSTNDQLVKKPNWSVGTCRHLIELLSNGSTWIPNDEMSFTPLMRAADEVGTDIRLSSLINHHDILNKTSTDRFFPMIDSNYLQFKIRATVKSSQWITLMKKGILMLLQPKVLVIKLASNNATAETARGNHSPSQQRLAACDSLCSEFSVYAKGNIKTLFVILDVLSPLSPQENMARRSQPETYKLIFKTQSGSESPEDLEMLMRMSTASYKISNDTEAKYLKATPPPRPKPLPNEAEQEIAPSCESRAIVVAFEDKQKLVQANAKTTLDTIDENTISKTVPQHIAQASSEESAVNTMPRRFENRTLLGASFVVLKHLFDSVGTSHDDEEGKELPVSLVVTNPTPDTLGRFINAACLSEDCSIGFDLEDNSFFVSSSRRNIQCMLEHLADYSHSAVVEKQFKLYERQKKESVS